MEEDKEYKVYCIENIVNGRKYIGCSSRAEKRIGQHFIDLRGGYHHNEYLADDFSIFGEESFKHYFICDTDSKGKKICEGTYINELGSYELVGGYNLDYFDFETGEFKRSKTTVKKLTDSHKQIWQNDESSSLQKQFIYQQKSTVPVIVFFLDTGKFRYFRSITDCKRDDINIKPSSVCRAVNNFPHCVMSKNGKFGAIKYSDFVELYKKDVEKVFNLIQENNKLRARVSKKKTHTYKPKVDTRVAKYDLKMNYICSFNNIKEADTDLGLSKSNVHQVASYLRNQTCGFIYRYLNRERDKFYKDKNLYKRKKVGEAGCKKVINPITGEIWKSVYEASLFNNIGYSALKMQLNPNSTNRNISGLMFLKNYNNES